MDEPVKPVVNHEVVGRRIRDNPDSPAIEVQNGSVRVLVGAFYEDRVDAHVSVDRFWAGSVSPKTRRDKIDELGGICTAEGWVPMMGWACARVADYSKATGVRGAIASPKPGVNLHHADVLKADWATIKAGDKGRDKREKAQIVAHALADMFNSLLNKNQSEFIHFPKPPEPA